MPRTILHAARVRGGSHKTPGHPDGERLDLDLELSDGRNVDGIYGGQESRLFTQAYMCRQRRLAFEVADDGSVKVRIPVGNEQRQVLSGSSRDEDLATLNDALSRHSAREIEMASHEPDIPAANKAGMSGRSNDQTDERQDPAAEHTMDWPAIQEFMDRLVEESARRDAKYIRLLGPGKDSGWLLVGDNPHESAKYQARRNHDGGEEFYFVSKHDRFDPNLRTPETARRIHGNPHPEPVWHRQKPWKDNFPLPADLWSEPITDRTRIPHQSPNDIRKGIADQIVKQLSKGPGKTMESLVVLQALKPPEDRER